MIIDAHIHLYPPSVYKTPVPWATANGENYWRSCVQPFSGRSLQGWASVDKLLKDMDQAGVDKVLIVGWYWENHDTCEENIRWQLEWTKQHPDRLMALAPFNAKGKQKAIDLVALALDAGFKGVGELNPPAQGYAYDDPYLDSLLELLASHRAIANFHVTDPNSKDYPGKIETPKPSLEKLLKQHPTTNFLLSHFGGYLFDKQDIAARKNLYFDTAAAPLLYADTVYSDFCDRFGHDRLLFGSDYPLRVFPRSANAPDFEEPIAALKDAKLPLDIQSALLGENAAKLLNIV